MTARGSDMIDIAGERVWTRDRLCRDLSALGVRAGDVAMVHAACRRVGPMLNGPDILIGAVLDAVGPGGSLLSYVGWDEAYTDALGPDGRLDEGVKPHVPPFDPASSRACRDHGVFAEFARTTPGARRSRNPGASCVALGALADRLTADHRLDYGYGEGSPFARLVEARGRVLMIGAPWDTMSLLHHAEHLARIPGKRVIRFETPFRSGEGGAEWRMIEEFDTADPVVDGLPADYFRMVVEDHVRAGEGRRGRVGDAEALLVEAPAITAFAVGWLERRFGRG